MDGKIAEQYDPVGQVVRSWTADDPLVRTLRPPDTVRAEVSAIEAGKKDPYQVFEDEHPELAARFDAVVQAQIQSPALDAKVKQLINIAIQTAAIAMNLQLTGLAAVLEALPAAADGYEMPLTTR